MRQRVRVVFVALALVVVGALIAPLGVAAPVGAATGVDTVLRNGYVYTVDDKNTVAQAVAIDDGVIVYVGNDRGVRGFIGPGTKVIDLDGRMVMPGLQDAHVHGITVGHPLCDLDYLPLTVEEFLGRIGQCLQNPEFGAAPDDWLEVDNWYIQFLRPPGTEVSKETLDALDTQRPIIVRSVFGHAALANSRALEAAGITADTPNPPGGVIDRDENGEATGWLYDGAQGLVRDAIPPKPPVDPVEAARRGMEVYAKEGITSFYAQGTGRQTVETFGRLRDQGGLTARAHFAIGADPATGKELAGLVDRLDTMRDELERPDQIPRQVRAWRPGHQRGPRVVAEPGVSIDGIAELSLDGISQYPAQTAALLEPYWVNTGTEENPNWEPGDNRGELYITPEVFTEMATTLDRSGYQIQTHAIGDRAVRVALDGFEAMREAGRGHGQGDGQGHGYGQGGNRGNGHGVDSRPSISHAEIVHPDDFGRFEELGVVPVMSYQWAKPGPDSTDAVKPYLGPTRWDRYEPEGQLYAAGAKIAFGSDYPVDPLDEFFALEVAVLRQADWGPDFPSYAGTLNADPGLSLPAAIRGMTINAAYAMHQDEVTGSIERGKLADLLILDQNLFEVPPDDISETKVLLTMVGGDVVYRDEGFRP